MMRNIQNLEKQTKYNLLITTFTLATFIVLVLNAFYAIIYMFDIIKESDFETISIAFKHGYYEINSKQIGVSIFFNIIGILFFWVLMLYHTIKSIYDFDFFLDNFNNSD